MKLIIQTLDKKTVDIELETLENVTVLDLKKKLEEPYSTTADLIKLVCAGNMLSDEKLLTSYSIKDNTKIILVKSKPKAEPKPEPEPMPEVKNIDLDNEMPELENGNVVGGAVPLGMPAALASLLANNREGFVEMLMQSPEMQNIDQLNPQLIQSMLADPAFMQNVLSMGQMMENHAYEDVQHQENIVGIRLTPEQKAEVDEMMNMGLGSYQDILQYYVAFGYDMGATANAMLGN